jgi:hypothetical protein
MEWKDFTHVDFGIAPVSEQYRFGCWVLGAAMILVGTIGGWREDAGSSDHHV